VFELTPDGSGTWTEKVLYSFMGGADGINPETSLAIDQSGNLYGTTLGGGVSGCTYEGCGITYEVSPNGDGTWSETVLHSFGGPGDGWWPFSPLVLDNAGNLYGTAALGGAYTTYNNQGGGTVFKLTQSGGDWSESVLSAGCDRIRLDGKSLRNHEHRGCIYATNYRRRHLVPVNAEWKRMAGNHHSYLSYL
jgi:hypothetical protein